MAKEINNEHDVGYKYVLSAKHVFVQLLRSFVKSGWVEQVDEARLELVNKSFVLPDFKEKEADLVYQMQMKDKNVIFYVLMELQSTVDFQMPYRILLYMVEIWREYIKSSDEKAVKQKSFPLPVIIPIVLYNGKNRWTVPLEFKEMLNQAELFGDNVLNYKYILLDVKRYDEKELLEISNLISSIFFIDRETKNIKEIFDRFFQLVDILSELTDKEFELFITWFKRIPLQRVPKEYKKEIEEILDNVKPKEVGKMISPLGESIQRIIDEEKEKGMEKGLKKGAINVARKLLLKGMTIDEIAEITELDKNEIRKLADTLE